MWYTKYFNIPFKYGGRDKNGLDCWGLIVFIFLQELRVQLISGLKEYTENLTKERIQEILLKESELWEKIKKPKEFDVVLLRIGGLQAHVGIIVDTDLMIHITKGTSVVLEKINTPKWKNRISGFYRYG